MTQDKRDYLEISTCLNDPINQTALRRHFLDFSPVVLQPLPWAPFGNRCVLIVRYMVLSHRNAGTQEHRQNSRETRAMHAHTTYSTRCIVCRAIRCT